MKIKKFFAGVTVSLMVGLAFAGCTTAPAPEKAPEEVIQEGLANMATITSYKYDVALNGDVKEPMSGNVKFNVRVNGAVDVKDMKDPKVSVKFDGSANDGEGMSGSVKAEMMMNNQAVYFNLGSLDLGEEGMLPPDVMEYMGKWWMITLPPEVMEQISMASDNGEMDMSDLKEMLENTKVFATPEYVGTENVAGDPSWRYKVVLDKKAFLEFAKRASESRGEAISAADMAEAEEAFKNVDITGDVWVSTTSNVMNQYKGNVAFKGGEGEASGNLSLSLTLSDINKPVTLNIPAGAVEFPMEEFLGPIMMMMGGGMMDYDDSMMYDDYDYEDDYDFDPSMFEGTEMTDEEWEALMGGVEL